MSFRWNLSRDVSDRSFFAQGNELIATSIGLTGNRTALSCRLNVDNRDYRYCKSQQEVLQSLRIIEKKAKRWAFRQLQKHTHYHRQYTKSIFVPEALSNGDYTALTKFLGNLRNNRINSYIKLNLQESQGYFHKAVTILKPTTRLFRERIQFAFTNLKRHMIHQRETEKNKILIDIERYSSIENQNSICSQPQIKPKEDVVNVTYVKVKLNPETIHSRIFQKDQYSHREASTARKSTCSHVANYIDLNDLIDRKRIREYQFKHINHQSEVKVQSQRIIKNKNG